MTSWGRSIAVGSVLCLGTGAAMGQTLLDRRSEAPAASAPASVNEQALRQSLVDLNRQLEELGSEVKQLRNANEVQGHELEQLKARQRDVFEDMDRRLRDVERRAVAAPAEASADPVEAKDNKDGKDSKTGKAGAGAKRGTAADEQKEYDAAFALMKQGYYDRAVKGFREFNSKHPQSALADNAQYWSAEGNYVLRNYKVALEEFNRVVSEYPQSTKIPDARLKIGYTYYELGKYAEARKVLGDVSTRYAKTTVGKLAVARLEKMKLEGK